MAAVQQRNGRYRVLFRFHGKQHTFTLGRVSETEAQAKADQVEYLLMRLKQGLLQLPPGGDIVAFVQHDGVVPVTNHGQLVTRDEPTLADLRDRYFETHANGTLEERTLDGIRQHFDHLVRILGEGFPIRELSLADLQGYVDRRTKAKGRHGALSPATIKKEIVTLRTAWNWGVRMKIVAGRFPYDGLRYPKTDEKPPFQTREEIKRQLSGLTAQAADELWEALYLHVEEIESLLRYVREHATHGWVYPLLTTAAHTGARRSELLRMRVSDVDFTACAVIIREKKRQKGRRTQRRVPLSSALAAILQDWISQHPGGPYLFCHAAEVPHSKKRSRATGYQSGKGRATTLKGRLASVRPRAARVRAADRRRGARSSEADAGRLGMGGRPGIPHPPPLLHLGLRQQGN